MSIVKTPNATEKALHRFFSSERIDGASIAEWADESSWMWKGNGPDGYTEWFKCTDFMIDELEDLGISVCRHLTERGKDPWNQYPELYRNNIKPVEVHEPEPEPVKPSRYLIQSDDKKYSLHQPEKLQCQKYGFNSPKTAISPCEEIFWNTVNGTEVEAPQTPVKETPGAMWEALAIVAVPLAVTLNALLTTGFIPSQGSDAPNPTPIEQVRGN